MWLPFFFLVSLIPCLHAAVVNSNSVREFLTSNEPTPVVMWHGMGDCCCNPLSMGSVQKLIEEQIPGVYVNSLMLGENLASDTERGFFANMNDLVRMACEIIGNDTKLQKGYHAIGFSQGGLFLRAVAQRCPSPPMLNLVSIGGPQQGIYGLPYCVGPTTLCNTVRKLLDWGAYFGPVQNNVVQAQYWHDAMAEDDYRKKSIFLAEINGEQGPHPEYKTNLASLKNFLLIQFTKDKMVVPKESEWFGYYKIGDDKIVLPMNETALYQEDKIGIRTLQEAGKLHFLAVDGDHLQIPREILVNDVIDKFLK